VNQSWSELETAKVAAKIANVFDLNTNFLGLRTVSSLFPAILLLVLRIQLARQHPAGNRWREPTIVSSSEAAQ